MRWILLVAAIALSLNVHASRFEGRNGKYIMAGDSVGKLLMSAGEPFRKRFNTVCVEQKRNYCNRWANVEYWYYPSRTDESVIWTLTIMNEKVVNLKWSR